MCWVGTWPEWVWKDGVKKGGWYLNYMKLEGVKWKATGFLELGIQPFYGNKKNPTFYFFVRVLVGELVVGLHANINMQIIAPLALWISLHFYFYFSFVSSSFLITWLCSLWPCGLVGSFITPNLDPQDCLDVTSSPITKRLLFGCFNLKLQHK